MFDQVEWRFASTFLKPAHHPWWNRYLTLKGRESPPSECCNSIVFCTFCFMRTLISRVGVSEPRSCIGAVRDDRLRARDELVPIAQPGGRTLGNSRGELKGAIS